MIKYLILLIFVVSTALILAFSSPQHNLVQTFQQQRLNSPISMNIPNELMLKFQDWKRTFGRIYQDESEEMYRLQTYLENLVHIELENLKGHSHTLGENQFMDLSSEEWEALYLDISQVPVEDYTDYQNDFVEEENLQHTKEKIQSTVGSDTNLQLKQIKRNLKQDGEAFNWKDRGAVTPVQNQGICQAGWAFTAAGVVEGFWKLKKGKLPELSAQQLLDCANYKYGNQGCQGGLPANALRYIQENGISESKMYRYTGMTQSCLWPGGDYSIEQIVSYQGCDAVTEKLSKQPTGIRVNAKNWQFYKGGVFQSCTKDDPNHAVLLVGWDRDKNWIAKNSFGVLWGEKGYIKLKKGNSCGVCNQPVNVS